MLDHLRLALLISPVYVKTLGNRHWFDGDLLDLDLPCATRHVSKTDEGQIITGTLYHPFESLPSDFTDLAIKFYTDTTNTLPYVELKASPLKLLQGHNVYGFDCIRLGSIEMLGMLLGSYSKLCAILDFSNIELFHLDTTMFFRLPHQNMVQPVLDFLANTSGGHRKVRSVKYDNYVTWGNENSRYINIKAYGKFEEVKEQLDKFQKQADRGCPRAKQIVIAMHDVLKFANAVIRLEARICKTYLTKNGYPSNLWQLIDLQQSNPNLLNELWSISFSPILKTLEGKYMNFANDDELLEVLKSKLVTYTKKGKKSYTIANNAFKLYLNIRQLGWINAKKVYSESTFYKTLEYLDLCEIPRSQLQNLHRNPNGQVIPFVRLVEIKLNEQLPPDYVMPTSKYESLYPLLRRFHPKLAS
ncbi:phage/plasmid replication protein, II/X family [Acinetobacter puyangensis]|uniref:phage/plasmid replication protein, II/X family n=1 Tax=Acinetobacter puyangensis TaxID=1096779 RepID=UPI003A4D685F